MLGHETFLDDPLDSFSRWRGESHDITTPSSDEPGSLTSILSIKEAFIARRVRNKTSRIGRCKVI